MRIATLRAGIPSTSSRVPSPACRLAPRERIVLVYGVSFTPLVTMLCARDLDLVRGRGAMFLPACHQKRALEKAGWVAEHVCAEVPHRQFVFILPKRLRTEPFLKPWEQEVFALLLAKGRITNEVMADMGFWKHSGFSVDQSGWSKAEPKSKAVADVSGRQFQPVSP